MPTYLKYKYIFFSSFRFKVGSGSVFFPAEPDPDQWKKMLDPHPWLNLNLIPVYFLELWKSAMHNRTFFCAPHRKFIHFSDTEWTRTNLSAILNRLPFLACIQRSNTQKRFCKATRCLTKWWMRHGRRTTRATFQRFASKPRTMDRWRNFFFFTFFLFPWYRPQGLLKYFFCYGNFSTPLK